MQINLVTKEKKMHENNYREYKRTGTEKRKSDHIKSGGGRRKKESRRMKRLRRRRRLLIAAMLAVLLLPAGGILLFLNMHPLFLKQDVIEQELQGSFDPAENIRYVFGGNPEQVRTEGDVDLSKPGDYTIKYLYKHYSRKVTVQVRDTVPPELEVHPYTTDLAEEITVDKFVEKVSDASEVSVDFQDPEEWNEAKEYKVCIKAIDSEGNKTVKETTLTRIKDETGPVISGTDEIEVLQGGWVDFLAGVTVSDDMDPNPSLDMDDTKADLNTPGVCYVVYTAKDRSGNVTERMAKEMLDTLRIEGGEEQVHIAYGTIVSDIKEVSKSYKEAKLALDVGKIFFQEKDIVAYTTLGIGRLIYQLPIPLCKMFIKEIFEGKSPDDFDEETLTTINKFFENSLNVSETSRQLYIHRNTLVYRLDKLQKSTGLDLRVFEDAITFKIALMVVQYMNYMESQEY